jgi:peptidyl-prolyl cis-trans isomerase A (cyclophilin A)
MTSTKPRNYWYQLALCLFLFLSAPVATAGTLVSVATPVGSFTVELFDDVAPVTVANFLSYVTTGRYDGTVVHRSEQGFVIQGGWLSFDEQSANLMALQPDGTIVNEPGISNTRGTIAMAKVAGDPNSASSQWFINMADNTFLDTDNGGFTVFGQVLGDGMTVVDGINQVPTYDFPNLGNLPLFQYTPGNVTNDDLVTVEMSVIETAANSLNYSTGLLDIKLNAGEAGLLGLSFSIYSIEPNVVIQALAESVVILEGSVPGIASFNLATGNLTLPELSANGEVVFRNLVFLLTDAQNLLFTLQSFE